MADTSRPGSGGHLAQRFLRKSLCKDHRISDGGGKAGVARLAGTSYGHDLSFHRGHYGFCRRLCTGERGLVPWFPLPLAGDFHIPGTGDAIVPSADLIVLEALHWHEGSASGAGASRRSTLPQALLPRTPYCPVSATHYAASG